VAGPRQTQQGQQVSASVRALSIRWLLCVPIPHAGKTAGVVYLDQRGEGPGFTESHMKLLMQFSGRIGQLVGSASAARESVSGSAGQTNIVQKSLTKLRRAHAFQGLVGTTDAMRAAFEQIRETAATVDPVAIVGEPGTGRRTVAEIIHRLGPRAGIPPVVVTGSQSLPAAGAGTLVVIDLDPAKVEHGTGDARLIATGPPDLKLPGARRIALPPLRERLDDIPHLIDHFMDHVEGKTPAFGPGVLDAFLNYAWPGNVGEMEQEIRRLRIAGRTEVSLTDLPVWIRDPHAALAPGPLAERMVAFERSVMAQELQRQRGDPIAAARALGLTERTFRKRLKDLGIDPGA
jgi:two-component system C4-dicarboxylate transport response regulator DctD